MKYSPLPSPDPQQIQRQTTLASLLEPPQVAAPTPNMTPASQVMALQQSIGNSAVSRLLNGPGPSPFSAQSTATQAPAQQAATAAPQAAPAQQPAQAEPLSSQLPPGISLNLVEAQFKADMRDRVRFRMESAFTVFVDACRNVISQERARAAKKGDTSLILTLVDMALGFFAPGLIRMIPMELVRDELKTVASMTLGKVMPNSALQAYTYLQTDELIEEYVKLDYDKVKEGFLSVTEKVREGIKEKASSVYVETPTEMVVNKLKDDFRIVVQELSESLIGRTDAEIMGLHQVYDARVTTQGIYEGQLRDILRQSEDLDTFAEKEQKVGQPYEWQRYRIVELVVDGVPRLAVLKHNPAQVLQTRNHWTFHKYVSPEMQAAAVEKAKEQPGGLERIKPAPGQWYRDGPLVGHIPKPVVEEPKIVWLDAWGKPRLAIIEEVAGKTTFVSWVKQEDLEWAEVKGSRQPGGIQKYQDKQITGSIPRPE